MNITENKLLRFAASDGLQPLIKCIAIGRDPNLEAQLLQKSRQAHILEHTPRDAAERFSTAELIQKRLLRPDRELHWLLGENDDLAGVIWYGPKPLPAEHAILLPHIPPSELPEETPAIRLYEGYVGHGLAAPAMLESLRLYVRQKQEKGEPIKGIWLITNLDNPAAKAVYRKVGYRELTSDDKRTVMALTADQIQEMIKEAK